MAYTESEHQASVRERDREFKKEHFLFRLTSNPYKQVTVDVTDHRATISFADPQGKEVTYTIACTRVDSRLSFVRRIGGVLRSMHFPQHQDATSRRMIRDERAKLPQAPNPTAEDD